MKAFRDRTDAGRQLAELAVRYLTEQAVGGGVVLGLPRGGVPVAAEVARSLAWPLDVVLVRKLGVPTQPELAVGAIGEDGARVLNADVLDAAGVTPDQLAVAETRQRHELARQSTLYRGGREPVEVTGRAAMVVDDGMATGATARAACQVLRARGASRLVVGVPVASGSVVDALRREVEVLTALVPDRMLAVGEWYEDFSQVSDDEVVELLRRR